MKLCVKLRFLELRMCMFLCIELCSSMDVGRF